jgi:hypothetical protein
MELGSRINLINYRNLWREKARRLILIVVLVAVIFVFSFNSQSHKKDTSVKFQPTTLTPRAEAFIEDLRSCYGNDLLQQAYLVERGDKSFKKIKVFGDIDGDGIDDYVANVYITGGGQDGNVYVISGRDGKVIRTLIPQLRTQYYAQNIDLAGDIDNDGVQDIFVTNSGEVVIYSGQSGSIIRVHQGGSVNSEKGIARLGDINNDGVDDYLINYGGGSSAPNPTAYSGQNGNVIYNVAILSTSGSRLYFQGDFDNDNTPDYSIGNLIYSGQNGNVIRTFTLTFNLASITPNVIKDINGDGIDEIGLFDKIYSGVDDSLLFTLQGPGGVSPIPTKSPVDYQDYNGDGTRDIISGYGRIHSGVDGVILNQNSIPYSDYLTTANINSDNIEDVLTLVRKYSSQSNAIYAFTIEGVPLQPQRINMPVPLSGGLFHNYCAGSQQQPPDKSYQQFAIVDDIDNDGLDDFAISEPEYDNNRGRVSFISSQSGKVLRILQGQDQGDLFGGAIHSYLVGSQRNLLISAPKKNVNSLMEAGVIEIYQPPYSTATSTIEAVLSSFGLGVTLATGDINGDGNLDIISGSPDALNKQGYVNVYSGSNFNILFQVWGARIGDEVGMVVGSISDTDNDGKDELIYGKREAPFQPGTQQQPTTRGRWRLTVHNKYHLSETLNFPNLNTRINGISTEGDVNNDGYEDILIGTQNLGGMIERKIFLVSGHTGQILNNFPVQTSNLPSTGVFIKDANNDGSDDVLIGRTIFSGTSGEILSTKNPSQGKTSTSQVSHFLEDVNQDGFEDYAVVYSNGNGKKSYNSYMHTGVQVYGLDAQNRLNQETLELSWQGGSNDYHDGNLVVDGAPPGQTVQIYLSKKPDFTTYIESEATQYVKLDAENLLVVLEATAAPNGQARHPLILHRPENDPTTELYVQAITGTGINIQISNGLNLIRDVPPPIPSISEFGQVVEKPLLIVGSCPFTLAPNVCSQVAWQANFLEFYDQSLNNIAGFTPQINGAYNMPTPLPQRVLQYPSNAQGSVKISLRYWGTSGVGAGHIRLRHYSSNGQIKKDFIFSGRDTLENVVPLIVDESGEYLEVSGIQYGDATLFITEQ